jgi:uncharacterized phage-like protein YoqJ
MKTTNTIEQVRAESEYLVKKSQGIDIMYDRKAVIVLTPYSAKKGHYGIQFWTSREIRQLTSKNTDNTISTFIEML